MKKTFTEEELEAASEEEIEEQLQPENGANKRRAQDSDDGANSDEELPEVFTMTEGKSMAHQLSREEKASGRRIAAEVKKKKQEREAARKSEKEEASGQLGVDELKAGQDETFSAERDGLLDNSIVQFLSEREKSRTDEKVEPSPIKEPIKVKRLKSKKERRNGRVQVVDLSQDSSFIEERNALEFKHGHLYGSRIKRDASMLRKLARVS